MTEAEENTTQSKPTEAEKPSWIRRNFFQTCVVLLLAWIGTNLELVVDDRSTWWNIPAWQFAEVDVPVADDPPSLYELERSLSDSLDRITGKIVDIERNTRR